MKSITDAQFRAILDIYRGRPAALNVLDIVNPNENEHTRFLCQLLEYRKNSIRSFLKSFLNVISDAAFTSLTDEDFSKAQLRDQVDYIDCQIRIGAYAIIIENKIKGAGDQVKQIAGYIDKTTRDCPLDNIYVVYLTLVGGEPSKSSLPDDLRQRLDDRFVSLSYHQNLLKWLEEEVLPECAYKESLLISSIILYVNHLKGMLGQREDQKALATKLSAVIKCGLNRQGYAFLKTVLKEIPDTDTVCDTDAVRYSDLSAALNILLREMERINPYLNEDFVANALKWMFRDDPPSPYRSEWRSGCADVGPYISSIFNYEGQRYMQLMAGDLRIHLKCNPDGIKAGPYILSPDGTPSDLFADCRFGKGYLAQMGVVSDGGYYRLPFASFDEVKTPLTDVCFHIKHLVDILTRSPLAMKRTLDSNP